MRNDAHDDFDDVPILRAGTPDDDELLPAHVARGRQKAVRPASNGPLWALLLASFIALAGLGWWSFQQISLMEQQLVATQESFARISEEAAGRLQAISGKVDASESNSSTGSEALKLQIRQLQASLAEQGKQQEGVAGQAGDLGKRLEQVLADTREQQKAVTELQTQLQAQLKAVNTELAALKSGQVDGGKLDGQLKSLSSEVAAVKKQGAAIESLEQDVLVLKSQADNRPASAAAGGASVQEFDAFRGQTTRSLNTLQSQIQNLQQQINARP
ncbi:ATPase [Pseudomonas putida]|uniref:ATPase n=1 Tax=Pseudomonas putida TaxID=303 RepID=UPI00081909DC|nr:ATPase [Pseudomonas putida]OCT21669.1 ATPase [Pseudomonas putida]OCT22869.1 ATPase [Pseudomonas putida]OCT23440.1 ATPase [Pseudomonas putida]OCT36402.1 ATPase [Pseudomonas putida]